MILGTVSIVVAACVSHLHKLLLKRRLCSVPPVFCPNLSSLPPEDRKSLFCTPEQDAAFNFTADTAPRNCPSMTVAIDGDGNIMEQQPLLVVDHGALSEEKGRDKSRDIRGGTSRVNSTASTIPGRMCIRWRDTVLTTEGHPLLIEALALATSSHKSAQTLSAPALASVATHGMGSTDAVIDEPVAGTGWRATEDVATLGANASNRETSSESAFDPEQHYARAVASDGSRRELLNAEFEVKVNLSIDRMQRVV